MKTRPRHRASTPMLGLLLVAAMAVGCTEANSDQPATFPVSGKITYLSNPLTKGSVAFQPRSGRPATAKIGEDGSYRLGTFTSADGAIPGPYKVAIMVDDIDHHVLPKPGAPAPKKNLIPPQYRKAETSGLEVTVEKKDNTFDFDLK